ncbi:MAG TPA: TIGR02996 domain-containing protein [Kofleriaceae bacterium]|jgi:uncharacterized protein (TIGR02996 family)
MAKAPPKSSTKARPTPAGDPESAALLAAITRRPDDKKARLVYADRLQDRGDPRGEFIVLQCTRAELDDSDARVAEIATREAELLKKHRKAWTAFGDTKGARWEYRRGFVEKASLDAAAFAAHGDAILAAEPIEELNLWKIDELRAPGLAAVLALPLHHVKRLSIGRSRLSVADWTALASATTLGNVELLDASATGLGEVTGAAAAFATTTSLPKLRELRLNGAYLGDADIAAIATSTTLRIERLIATHNSFGAAAIEAIVAAPWAKHLVHLDLSSNEDIRSDGLEVLAAATTLPALETLRLDYAGIWSEGDRLVDVVLESPVFARLSLLDLSQNFGTEQRERIRAVFGARFKG